MTGRSAAGGGISAALRRQLARLVSGLLLLIVLLPATASAQSRGPAEVFGVRFGVNEDITRIVLDLDAATRFATRVLASPPRLVIELENVRWQIRSHPQGQPVGLATTVNYSTLDTGPGTGGAAGRGRLVIDVDRPFRILHQDRLPPSADAAHHRILVDLVPLETSPPPPPSPPATTVAGAVEPPTERPNSAAAPASPTTDSAPEPPTATARTSPSSPPLATPPLPRPVRAAPVRPESTTTEITPSEAVVTDPAVVVELPPLGTNDHHAPPITPDRVRSVDDLPETDGLSEADDGAEADGETTLAALPVQPAPAPPARRRIITLDPGHGGVDPGTVGINGVLEKEVTLDLAERLRDLIEATGRYEVVLTRESDVFVSLRDRMETARRSNAALFVSIHADSLGDSRFRGASVYTLSDQASDAEAARLATKENRADVIAGTDLSAHDEVVAGILIDLAQRVTNNKSIEFADVLTTELADVTALVRNTRRFAGFVVLKSPDVPSVLLELGYLSNPTDAANLARPEYRDKLARATLRAIDRYFRELDAAL